MVSGYLHFSKLNLISRWFKRLWNTIELSWAGQLLLRSWQVDNHISCSLNHVQSVPKKICGTLNKIVNIIHLDKKACKDEDEHFSHKPSPELILCKTFVFCFFSKDQLSYILYFLLSNFIICVLSIHRGALQSLAQQVSASVNDTVMTNVIRSQNIFLSHFSTACIIQATSFR